MARLSHPHVVTVHEVDEVDGQRLLAMEFVGGGSFVEWLRGHPLGGGQERVREALELLVQAAQGLIAAHGLGVRHGDVRACNMLVGVDGRMRVVGFGGSGSGRRWGR